MAKRKGDTVADATANSPAKRPKVSKSYAVGKFREGLFDEDQIQLMKESYAHSKPYKHGVLRNLIDDNLLKSVLKEVTSDVSYTMKETDIYRIHQSGDLANLDGLDSASLERLPNLLKLRNALYSETFRDYMSEVTGAGPLSGTKTDMAINIYKTGCHLLCHDDVIGSRRVSYILYLTEKWDRKWGGALRLYPTKLTRNAKGHKVHVPEADFSVSIPPSWNQMSFFAVQPGESYHDVEEVYPSGIRNYHDYHKRDIHEEKFLLDETPDDERSRIAISGWFHIPQPGEEGFEPGVEDREAKKSSLMQLKSNDAQFDLPEVYAVPFLCYPKSAPQFIDPKSSKYAELAKMGWKLGKVGPEEPLEPEVTWDGLNEEECNFLLKHLNPRLLVPDTLSEVNREFNKESHITIDDFLNKKTANTLMAAICAEPATMQEMTTRESKESIWSAAGPPHKRRFMYIPPTEPDPNAQNLLTAQRNQQSPVRDLIAHVLNSMAFRKWLGYATGCIVKSHDLKARRFRRGLDYQLATSYNEKEPRLELTLGITPKGKWEPTLPEGKTWEDVNPEDLEQVHNGGEEAYMATDQDGESSSSEDEEMVSPSDSDSDAPTSKPAKLTSTKAHPAPKPSPRKPKDEKPKSKSEDPAVYNAADENDDDFLFHMPPAWNRVSLVMRDKATLKYVRFVNTSAEADRWDITGDYAIDWPKTNEIDLVEDSDDEESEDGDEDGNEDGHEDGDEDEDEDGNE